ncbi:neuronal acetylcholine receptor subunit alpha-2-like [Mytilus californianus]|uniref:neuronal acetylcholine receptor subunit alpha-2-like n=1 Tax=Mytilus californianus TaxID=6549 RepID=UPI0022461C0E|nr:neuronal acetylcholine receptor subunit alpha-2-like [Mytilus californianus]
MPALAILISSFFVICLGRIPDEQKLLEVLLKDYNPGARPVFNASHILLAKFGLTLIQISDMDEVNQVLTTNVWLEQEWIDERLVWNPADYNGLEILRMPCEKIWLPDIVLYNSADDFTSGYMQSKAMVSCNGTVFWPPPAKFRSSCKIDITFFPFDDQTCVMKFGSWTYDGFQVDLTNRSTFVDLSNYVYSGEWELLDIRVVRNEVYYACCPVPYPDVTFTIVIRRKTLYYLFNIIFPCLWLSILSLLGFWLPPDSGEKITLGITVLLAFSVFMLLIAENMPATSEFVPLIGIYLTCTMGMTSMSIILTVFVLQLHHVGPHQRPVPKWLRIICFNFLGKIMCLRPPRPLNGLHCHYPQNDIYLAQFYEDITGNNCNGSIPNFRNNGNYSTEKDANHVHEKITSEVEVDNTQERITNHLKLLIDKQDYEDRHQCIVNDWRFVALTMDRILFWLFLSATTLSSIAILIIQPMMKPKV